MSLRSLVLAIPNKGRLCDATIDFLEKCSLFVRRESTRQYQAKMTGLEDDIEVVFQRVHDIPRLVRDKRADLGITGLDIFCEKYRKDPESAKSELFSIFPDRIEPKERKIPGLPYGYCQLVIAVPDHWVDIASAHDLPEKAREIEKNTGHPMRVATEFRALTHAFLLDIGVSHFDIIDVHGAAEIAPRMGSAEIVVDLRSSGVTLMENRLKEIERGNILSSSGCLIASREQFMEKGSDGEKRRRLAKQFVDRIEAYLKARKFSLITANVEIAPMKNKVDYLTVLSEQLCADLEDYDIELLGRQGPTVAPVLNLPERIPGSAHIYSVSIQIESRNLERVIEILRKKTGRDILVSPITFVYDKEPEVYNLLKERLDIKDEDLW